jgi:hypothetical protein
LPFGGFTPHIIPDTFIAGIIIIAHKIGLLLYKRRIGCKNNRAVFKLIFARLDRLIIFSVSIRRQAIDSEKALPVFYGIAVNVV